MINVLIEHVNNTPILVMIEVTNEILAIFSVRTGVMVFSDKGFTSTLSTFLCKWDLTNIFPLKITYPIFYSWNIMEAMNKRWTTRNQFIVSFVL